MQVWPMPRSLLNFPLRAARASACLCFLLCFVASPSQRWQNSHSTPLRHSPLLQKKSHGVQVPRWWPAEPRDGSAASDEDNGMGGGATNCTCGPSSAEHELLNASERSLSSASAGRQSATCASPCRARPGTYPMSASDARRLWLVQRLLPVLSPVLLPGLLPVLLHLPMLDGLPRCPATFAT